MQTRPLGQSGIEATVVALGAWAIGGWMWGGTDEDESVRTVHAALDAGVNFIDTAAVYGYGKSEEILGKALSGRRESVVLATKGGLNWNLKEEKGVFSFHGTPEGQTDKPAQYKVFQCLDPVELERELEQSLRRLRTDYIDLYQTHRQDPATPIDDTMALLLRMKDQGKIRAIGVSRCTVEQLRQYGRIDASQDPCSMIDRQIEQNGVLDYCRENGISMMAYSPLARGLLTGKMTPDRTFNPGDQRLNNPRFAPDNLKKANAMLVEMQPIAAAHNATIAQLVIAWTLARPGITHALCGARTPRQAIENAAAGDIHLKDEDVTAVNEIIARYNII